MNLGSGVGMGGEGGEEIGGKRGYDECNRANSSSHEETGKEKKKKKSSS